MEKTIYDGIIIAWFALSAVSCAALCGLTAPYGRHMRQGWGADIGNRWGWILMEAPSAIVMAVCLYIGSPNSVAWFLGGLWLLHYVHRSFIFPFRIRDTGKRMPLAIALSGAAFNVVNAYLNGRSLTVFHQLPEAWWSDPRFVIGVAVFALGAAINVHSDQVLMNLRRPGDVGYRIPEGGLYRWVSCPNYLGEMIEWTGWAIATWSLAGAAFAIWTIANLAPRAHTHHRWYQNKFSEYPRERRALLPGVF